MKKPRGNPKKQKAKKQRLRNKLNRYFIFILIVTAKAPKHHNNFVVKLAQTIFAPMRPVT